MGVAGIKRCLANVVLKKGNVDAGEQMYRDNIDLELRLEEAISEASNCLKMYERIYSMNLEHPRILTVKADIHKWSAEL